MIILDKRTGTLKLFVFGDVPEQVTNPRAEKASQPSLAERIGASTWECLHRVGRRDTPSDEIQCGEVTACLDEILVFATPKLLTEGSHFSEQFADAQFAERARERGQFEVSVGVDQPRHDEPTASVDDGFGDCIGVVRFRGPNRLNYPIVDDNRSVSIQVIVLVDSQHRRVVNQDIWRHGRGTELFAAFGLARLAGFEVRAGNLGSGRACVDPI